MPRPSVKPVPSDRSAGRRERIGLSIFDLDVVHPEVRAGFLGGKLDLSRERIARVDGDAVAPFSCLLVEAAVAADLVRSECRRVGDPPPRAYVSIAMAWRRLPPEAVLTEVRDGVLTLSEEWFPPLPGEIAFRPPSFGPVVR